MQCQDPRVVEKLISCSGLLIEINSYYSEKQMLFIACIAWLSKKKKKFTINITCNSHCLLSCFLHVKNRSSDYLFNMSGLFWWSCTVVTMHNFLLPFGWWGFKLILTSSTVPMHCHATFPSALMRNQDTAASCQEGCTSFPQLPSLLILSFLLFLPSFQTDTVPSHICTYLCSSLVRSLALQ